MYIKFTKATAPSAIWRFMRKECKIAVVAEEQPVVAEEQRRISSRLQPFHNIGREQA